MVNTTFKETLVKFGTYWRCVHCGNFTGKTKKDYCEFCKNKAGRLDGCIENKKIFKENGLNEPNCRMCEI